MGVPTKFDADRRSLYLTELEKLGEVRPAAARVGIHRDTVYKTMKNDPEFAEACEQALGRKLARAFETFDEVAIEGTIVTHYDKDGNVIKEERKVDTRALLRFIERHERAWRPGLDVDKKVTEHKTIDIRNMSAEDKATMRDLLLRNRLNEPSEN